jgi:hypothetical protein
MTHNAQRTTHNAQRTTHNAQRTSYWAKLTLCASLLLPPMCFASSSKTPTTVDLKDFYPVIYPMYSGHGGNKNPDLDSLIRVASNLSEEFDQAIALTTPKVALEDLRDRRAKLAELITMDPDLIVSRSKIERAEQELAEAKRQYEADQQKLALSLRQADQIYADLEKRAQQALTQTTESASNK